MLKTLISSNAVMLIYNLIEYNNDYLKTFGRLWQYYRDKPVTNDAAITVDFINNGDSKSLSFQEKIKYQTTKGGRKDFGKMVLLKYLSNVWRTLHMYLINCEVNLVLTWSTNCVVTSCTSANQATTFAVTDRKLYIPVATLLTEGNSKLLHQLKSGFKCTVN